MAKTIKSSELADTVNSFLSLATEEYTEIMKDVIDDVAQGVMDETKKHITWKDREYSKSFALTTTLEQKRKKSKLWYVKSPHYRLTHLLEFGHYKRNGEWGTKAFPHVLKGYEFARDNFEKELRERIENAKLKDNP